MEDCHGNPIQDMTKPAHVRRDREKKKDQVEIAPTHPIFKQRFESSCKIPHQVGLDGSVAHCYADHIIASTDRCLLASAWALCFTTVLKWQASVSGSVRKEHLVLPSGE
jgi:organic hydroperoxide reductase OsmC/OhrA